MIDTDPVNATFSQYQAWPVERLQIQDEGSTRINERRFNDLMELLLKDEADVVIDIGAASFVPLSNYLTENAAISLLVDASACIRSSPEVKDSVTRSTGSIKPRGKCPTMSICTSG